MTTATWTAARGDKWTASLDPMEAMLAPVDRPLVEALRLHQPCRIADIGCGGGGASAAIAAAAPAGSIVHGFDISAPLITAARTRVPAAQFTVADAATDTPPEPFHRLASRFGVMFFEEPEFAFANLARWLAPSGRFAFALWGPLEHNPWMHEVRNIVAQFHPVPPIDPSRPGPFRSVPATLTHLETAGFTAVEVQHIRLQLPIGGGLPPREAARFALSSFANFAELLRKSGATAAAEQQLAIRYTSFLTNGAVTMDAEIAIVTGTRPA